MKNKVLVFLLFVAVLFALGCMLAGATEIGQTYTKYRSGDLKDFKADGLALGISCLIVLVIDLAKQCKKR